MQNTPALCLNCGEQFPGAPICEKCSVEKDSFSESDFDLFPAVIQDGKAVPARLLADVAAAKQAIEAGEHHASPDPTCQVVNLCKSDIVLHRPDGTQELYPASGTVCTVSETTDYAPGYPVEIGDCLVLRTQYEGVHNLPDPEDGVFYIVSALALAAIRASAAHAGRCDVIAPGRQKLDSYGRAIGCETWKC